MDDRRRRFEMQALPHLDAAHNFACWLTRSHADADDIVQEAMLRAWRSFDGFRGTDMKPWLLAIVRNCFATAHRRRRHVSLTGTADGDESPEFTDDAPDPEALALRAGDSRALNKLIAAIPQEFREVLVLREMEELSYRDIARITGAPIGTIMSRLSRARALLKQRWLEQVEGERNAVQ